ncbi:MAG: acetyl-CoA carboxylase biotin carboxyl carrier protein [Bacteroidota bacterium]|nr:acetyl-CoA carboxylase biotin carboxyl carrier protein [Bacteroidota bacterium]
MDVQLIRKLVKIVTDSQIAELEIEEEGIRLRVTRTHYSEAPITQLTPAVQAAAVPPAVTAATAAPETADSAGTAPPETSVQGHEVRSPIVGTFYRAPSPDSDPYVEVGQSVSSGQSICIIEAMKIMNEIEADASGRIVKILVEDGQPVEYNQPLFIIDPS